MMACGITQDVGHASVTPYTTLIRACGKALAVDKAFLTLNPNPDPNPNPNPNPNLLGPEFDAAAAVLLREDRAEVEVGEDVRAWRGLGLGPAWSSHSAVPWWPWKLA